MWQRSLAILIDRVILIINCLATVFVSLGWAVLLWPLQILDRKLHYRILLRMCTFIADQLPSMISVSGFEVGEDVSSCYGENCLVICNHQSSFDPIILMLTFRLKGIFEKTMWMMDYWIRYTPFGPCAWIRGDFFIIQGKNNKTLEQTRIKQNLLNDPIGSDRRWIIFFPEGGFLSKRRLRSQRYAKEHGLPVFQHVCLPRTGAFETVISTLHPKNTSISKNSRPNVENVETPKTLKWIIDITVGYKPNIDLPSFETFGIFSTKESTVFLHYRIFPIEEVPDDPEGQKRWLYRIYEEKEDLLRVFHETGAFPKHLHTRNRILDSPVPIKSNAWNTMFAYIFLVVSMGFQIWILKSCVNFFVQW